MKNWNQVKLVPEFNEQGVACYKLAGGRLCKMNIMLYRKQRQESF